jgi:hypothetical protein
MRLRDNTKITPRWRKPATLDASVRTRVRAVSPDKTSVS